MKKSQANFIIFVSVLPLFILVGLAAIGVYHAHDYFENRKGKYHVLVLEGDNVVKDIRVAGDKFIFVFGGKGNGIHGAYKDTTNDDPMWPLTLENYSNHLGKGHQEAIKKRVLEDFKNGTAYFNR